MNEDLHEHDIDGLFRRGLEGAEDSPSPGLWSAIEKGLGPATPHAPQPAPGTGGNWMHPLLLKGMAGIAILATVGTVSYYLGRDSQRREERSARTTASEAIQKQSTPPSKTPDAKADKVQHPTVQTPPVDAGQYEPQTLGTDKFPTHEAATDDNAASNETLGQTDIGRPKVTEAARGSTVSLPGNTGNRQSPSGKPERSTERRKIASKNNLTLTEGPADVDILPANKEREVSAKKESLTDLADRKQIGYQPPVFITIPAPGKALNLMAPDPTTLRVPGPVQEETKTLSKAAASGSRVSREFSSRLSLMPLISMNSTQKQIREDESFGPRSGREHREMAETESYGTTVSPGLYAAFDITPRLSVQSGYSELRNEISISPKDIRAVRDRDGKVRYRLDCSAGSFFIDPKTGSTPGVGDSIRLKSSDVRTRYATIPVHLLYRVGSGRVRGFAMAGADVNILVNRNATTTLQNASGLTFGTVRAEGLKPKTVNAVVGAGVELGLGKRMAITVMPQYRVALNSPNVGAPVKTYPKTLSLSAGLRVSF